MKIPTIEEVNEYAKSLEYKPFVVAKWFEDMRKQDWRMNGEPVRNWRAVLDGKMRFELANSKKAIDDHAVKRLSYSLYGKGTSW